MSDQRERPDEGVSEERPVSIPPELPVLPLRDTVLFPNSFMPLAVAREASVRLIDEAIEGDRLIAVFTQREASVEEPKQEDLYPVGTATHIHKMFKLPDGSLRLIVQGLQRLELTACHPAAPVPARRSGRRGGSAPRRRSARDRRAARATSRPTSSRWSRCRRCCPTICRARREHRRARQAGRLHRLQPVDDHHRREAGSARNARRASARMDTLNRILIKELEVLELGSKIQSQVQSEVGKNQREYFLREQLKAIQRELGEDDEQQKEIERAARQDRSGRHAGAGEEGSAARAGPARQDAGRRRRIHGLAHVSRLARRAAVDEAHR